MQSHIVRGYELEAMVRDHEERIHTLEVELGDQIVRFTRLMEKLGIREEEVEPPDARATPTAPQGQGGGEAKA